MAGFGAPLCQCPARSGGTSLCRKGVTWGGAGAGGEGCRGSWQKLVSRKLLPLQPISGLSLLTYVFPFTLQYVCQRAIAPLTRTLLFMPSLFTHFNPAPFITAHPSSSPSSTSNSYFFICLIFHPLFFVAISFSPLNFCSPSIPSNVTTSFPLIHSLVLFTLTPRGSKLKAILMCKEMASLGPNLDFIWSYLRSQEPWTTSSSFLTAAEDTEPRGGR